MILWLGICLGLELPAQERDQPPRRGVDEIRKILSGLEHGMNALRALGLYKDVERLEYIAADLKQDLGALERRRHGDEERKVARQQLKVMRYGVEALVEARKRDAAHLLEHAMHAMELRLEGRKDEKAMCIYKTAPKRGQVAELLGVAAECLQEIKKLDRAEAVGRLARVFARKREGRSEENRERKEARRQIKIMRYAMEALVKGGRRDSAELLEHAIHAQELALEGRRDDEAMRIRETAPSLGARVELLVFASKFLREYGRIEQAQAAHQLVERFRSRLAGGGKKADQRRRALHRIEEIQEEIAGLLERMEKFQAELRRLKRRL